MRVAIAGSSGLIGTALVPLLRQAGHDVLRLVRSRSRAPDERSWDPSAATMDVGTLEGTDAVVNLCGSALANRRWSGEIKQAIRDSRIGPTEVLAAAVAEHRVPILINASGVGYYGDTGNREVDETAPVGSGFLAQVCRDWEAATAPAERAGARVVRVRTGLVISPSGGLMGQLKPLFALGLGAQLGSGGQYMPWISLDDEVGAIRFALEHDELSGPVNLSGPDPVTNAEFTRAMGEVMHRPTPLVVPGFALRLLRGTELVKEMVLTGQRAVPAVLRTHGYPFQHPTLTAALVAALE
ncbi:MAG: TIGR01777 family oxidoreductase [Pseudonocardiales bacterium]|nr:TIGR01777 family oxidoreductase [Pseudonocardiales bacterium]MBV9728617.1 TIGR01777 family oxidoreductase [Pseudonocardiales bacterium]